MSAKGKGLLPCVRFDEEISSNFMAFAVTKFALLDQSPFASAYRYERRRIPKQAKKHLRIGQQTFFVILATVAHHGDIAPVFVRQGVVEGVKIVLLVERLYHVKGGRRGDGGVPVVLVARARR